MLIKGTDLNEKQKKQVCNAFVYRWTFENYDRASQGYGRLGCPTIGLIWDDDWLSQYSFHFVKDGSRLAANRHHCVRT